MKKLLFIFALSLQTAFVFAADKTEVLASARYENSKMYRQPGTSTQVLRAVNSTDEIVVVRKYNSNWSIVTINGQVGYMLTSELAQAKPQPAKTLARK
ncbi:hypothetical protein AAE02nite_22020 [Adhaeribacter aerolatus]|uniref:SH3b domain-containing protein n=1 Tax=Adhaeribacter aerolatus TaxID=670289 RepID=A0A512AXU8_9BACT|nr:SH3 domain-containing protein [Adhaeribacter aerolatus]GEO04538.1 hypothetical protein AAE02nite_22020 [Adhaeribacter aerolatus]